MHEYRDSRIATLMLKVNPNTSDVDLFVAAKMLEMCGIEPVLGSEPVARALILGVGLSTLACGLGSRDFGHNVVGICFHAANVHQQNFNRNKLRSRARFTYSTTKDLLLAMPGFTWDFVFVLPYVKWDEVSDFTLKRMVNSQIVVAQRVPMDVEDFEHIYFRTTAKGYCHETENVEEATYVIFKVR